MRRHIRHRSGPRGSVNKNCLNWVGGHVLVDMLADMMPDMSCLAWVGWRVGWLTCLPDLGRLILVTRHTSGLTWVCWFGLADVGWLTWISWLELIDMLTWVSWHGFADSGWLTWVGWQWLPDIVRLTWVGEHGCLTWVVDTGWIAWHGLVEMVALHELVVCVG